MKSDKSQLKKLQSEENSKVVPCGRKFDECIVAKGPKAFNSYRIGDNICGEKIEIIYHSSNEHRYIVFKPKDKDIICYDYDNLEQDDNLAGISLYLAKVNSLLSLENNSGKYLPLIAQVYMNCLSGKPEVAIKVLEEIERKIINVRKIRCRLFYLFYCIVFLIINIGICAVLVNSEFESIKKIQSQLTLLYKLATFGSIGGFISVALNIKKLEFEPDEGYINSIVSAFSRIFVSMLSAIIVYYAIKTKLILNIAEKDIGSIYVLCAASGFSERFVLGIFKNSEDSSKKTKAGEKAMQSETEA